MTLSQFVRLHVETGRVFRLLAKTCGAGHARRRPAARAAVNPYGDRLELRRKS